MSELSIGQLATLACLYEASAPKVGNVHPQAAFAEMDFGDFLASAVAIGPAMNRASRDGVGRTVLSAAEATRQLVGKNTNLGTILLLAPLAASSPDRPCTGEIARVLNRLDSADCDAVYQAIRVARPGGLGQAVRDDVRGDPPEDLRTAMSLAADRDLVARQYVNNFAELLDFVVPTLVGSVRSTASMNEGIVHCQLQVMAAYPDSLIWRKCGETMAREAASRAAAISESTEWGSLWDRRALADFDAWLRADGNRRNPGTTADLIAAALFVVLRDGLLNEVRK